MTVKVAARAPDFQKDLIGFGFVLLAVILFFTVALLRHEFPLSSYKAFYCAGEVVANGGNPYTVEPLRTCEHAAYHSPDFPAFAVEPAPLPGYALALFELAAFLPAQTSHVLFLALLIAALGVAGWTLAHVTGLSPIITTLTCLSLWMLNAGYAEIPPLTVAAIALCGLALMRERPIEAALWACAAMVQPHVALPLCAALLVFVPRSRLPLLIGGAGLLLLSVLVVGPHLTASYYTTYLPLQASSEIIATDQYSLTHVLHVLGTSDRFALVFGSLSYATMTVLGIFAGRRLAARFDTPAFLAYTPPAFVLFLGSYVHDLQIFSALPLVLLLVARARPIRTDLAFAALLLCVVWTQTGSSAALLCAFVACTTTGMILFSGRRQPMIRAAILGVCLTLAVIALNRLPSASMLQSDANVMVDPHASASIAWKTLLQSVPSRSDPSPRSEGRKAPTWLGLALLVGYALTVRGVSDKEAGGRTSERG